LRPQTLLDRFRRLSAAAGAPKVTLHDLRHLAATQTITAGVPLVVVSKTLRHSTLSTTANIYAHLTRPAARGAVNAIQRALTHAEQTLGMQPDNPHHQRTPTPPREQRGRLQRILEPLTSGAVVNRDTAVNPQPPELKRTSRSIVAARVAPDPRAASPRPRIRPGNTTRRPMTV
jgi:hypothetical protein